MRQILVLSSAREDLLQIQIYTLEVWGDRKVIELQELMDTTMSDLVRSPFMGRKTNSKNLYAKVLGKLPFIMMYTVDDDFICVTKIIHSSRRR